MTPKSLSLLLAYSLLVLGGCNSTADKAKGVLQSYSNGDLQAAVEASAVLVDKAKEKDLPIAELNAAVPYMAAGSFEESANLFESWKSQSSLILTDVPDIRLSDEVLNTFTNATQLQYWSNPRETIMGSSVGALACLLNGDLQGARSNMSAARTFTQDALMREPKRLQAEMNGLKNQESMKESILKSAQEKYQERNISQESMLTSVDYPMYINPFSLWLNAIFYSSSDLSDQEIAKKYFSRLNEILQSPTSKRDADWAERSIGEGGTWILDFAGSAPKISTVKVSVPMGDGALATFGFPYMSRGNQAPAPFSVECDGNSGIASDLLCDYEGLAKKDFDAKLPVKIASEVWRGLASGAANKAMQEDQNALVKIGLNLVNNAMAESDERAWATAPAKVRLTRLGSAVGPINIYPENTAEPITLAGQDMQGVRVIVLFRPNDDAPVAIQEFTLRAK